MARKINISKYQNNTVYSVSVTDSYGNDHHLGYWKHFDFLEDIEKRAEEIGVTAGHEEIEEFLTHSGHNLTNCEWMAHKNPDIIIP
jgi:hypothetical protein